MGSFWVSAASVPLRGWLLPGPGCATVARGRFCSGLTELDSDFAAAYGIATWWYVQGKANRWATDHAQEMAETIRLARRAVDLGRDDAVALSRAADLEAGGDLSRMRSRSTPTWHLRGSRTLG